MNGDVADVVGLEHSNMRKTPQPKACVRCRTIKMKCRPVLGSPTCERCARKSFDCVFHHKKRGRKPGARLISSRRDLQDEATATSSRIHVTSESSNFSERLVPSLKDHAGSLGSCPVETPALAAPDSNGVGSDIWIESDSLQPPGLFKQAMKGNFSLENILCTAQDLRQDVPRSSSKSWEGDPIERGFVKYHIATSLFHGFMNNLNPLICVLDPALHTFQYVREMSSFLFTVILAAAAKAFNPDLHPKLYKHSEDLYMECVRYCVKSAEVIQAILIFTYWKQPNDTRSWSSIGYAIRLCMELGWHKLTINVSDISQSKSKVEARQRRSSERTWLVLFIHDRGMSFQTGKPWMIERSEFIESVNSWYKSSLSIPNDAALCALATLRLSTADIVDVYNPQRPSPAMNDPNRTSSLLRMLKPQLEAWEKYWTRITEGDTSHQFIVTFYGHHVRLFLYSHPLQASLSTHVGGSLIDNEAFWITYTSAVEMLKAATHPSMSPLLSFVPDSMHVMTAYAAVFLIKLLLSVHQAIGQEIESSVLETIREAARVFDLQATPATFGCALQAKFLNNCLREYENACRHRSVSDQIISNTKPGHFGCSQNHPTGSAAYDVRHSALLHSHISIQDNSKQDDNLNEARHQPRPDSSREEILQQDILSSRNVPLFEEQLTINNQTSAYNGAWDSTPMPTSYMFSDEQFWQSTFMNAGFHVGDGVFLPGDSR